MDSHIIPNVPRIAQFIGKESYLTPFIGSLYAALNGMGAPRRYAELLALSGAGNRLTWRPNDWYGGNCDILACEDEPFAPHLRVLKAIGFTAKIRLFKEIVGLKGPYDTLEHAREEITASIEKGIPVIAMGIIGPPECCVVYGFEKGGDILIGWNYFQDSEGFSPDQPFRKENWQQGLFGYLLLEKADTAPGQRESALNAFRAIADHARQYEVRGARVGFAAWEEMLRQLEHDDFSHLKGILLPQAGEIWDDDVWSTTAQGRFFIYCDALCQIHERGVALHYYQYLADHYPEWQESLNPAIAAWKECSAYGGFLWKYVTMDSKGYEKFTDSAIRKILADEGRRSMAKDMEAIEHIEALLKQVK
jgi:hypothetical protein